MGMPLDALSETQTIERVLSGVRGGRGGAVLPANLAVLREYTFSQALKPLMETIDVVVADGMPLVWASRLQGTPLRGRVAGSTMVWPLTAGLAAAGAPVFLLGGDPGVAARAADLFRAELPALRIAGVADPWIDAAASPDELADIAAMVAAADPAVVYLALPFEKQVRMVPALRAAVPGAWLIGLGVTLSFVTGDVARAPMWAQRSGLEWAHRLVQEPRLYRRYVIEGLPFAARLCLSALRTRRERRSRPAREPIHLG